VLPEGADTIKGREAIHAFWADAVKDIGDAKLTAMDVLPLGAEYLREIGTYHFKTKGDKPQELTGKYVVLWRKVGNDWLLATDIWNSNQ
jgi:ketosteroid isomerase-like protein